jgi:hypothetical protein
MTMTTAFATTTVPATGDADITTRPIFDALSAIRTVDGSIVVSGHIDHDGGAFPTPVVALDDDAARWLITTLTALLDRRGHLQVVA